MWQILYPVPPGKVSHTPHKPFGKKSVCARRMSTPLVMVSLHLGNLKQTIFLCDEHTFERAFCVYKIPPRTPLATRSSKIGLLFKKITIHVIDVHVKSMLRVMYLCFI